MITLVLYGAPALSVVLLVVVAAIRHARRRKQRYICLHGGRKPLQLSLPDGLKFHCFVSHCWSTGQAQAQFVVSQLKLHVAGIKPWLDVQQLDDVGKLEESVRASGVCIIFLSSGCASPADLTRDFH